MSRGGGRNGLVHERAHERLGSYVGAESAQASGSRGANLAIPIAKRYEQGMHRLSGAHVAEGVRGGRPAPGAAVSERRELAFHASAPLEVAGGGDARVTADLTRVPSEKRGEDLEIVGIEVRWTRLAVNESQSERAQTFLGFPATPCRPSEVESSQDERAHEDRGGTGQRHGRPSENALHVF